MVPLLKFRFTGGDRERAEARATARTRHLPGLRSRPRPLPRALPGETASARVKPGQGGRPLTLGDAVLGGQQPLLEEALQHGADGWAVHQLQHEQVGLQGRCGSGGVCQRVWARLPVLTPLSTTTWGPESPQLSLSCTGM